MNDCLDESNNTLSRVKLEVDDLTGFLFKGGARPMPKNHQDHSKTHPTHLKKSRDNSDWLPLVEGSVITESPKFTIRLINGRDQSQEPGYRTSLKLEPISFISYHFHIPTPRLLSFSKESKHYLNQKPPLCIICHEKYSLFMV